MRTTTSYGPVTYSDDDTPGRRASCLATTSARPTSVWISMKASTTRSPPSRCIDCWPQAPNVPQVWPGFRPRRSDMATDEPAETLAGVGEFAVIDRLVTGREQPDTVTV